MRQRLEQLTLFLDRGVVEFFANGGAVCGMLAPITGEIRRSRSTVPEGDKHYSHFQDSAGKSFRALADETGRRAGHFMDDAGNTFRGFADASVDGSTR